MYNEIQETSTAQVLLAELRGKGIKGGDINESHLRETYERMPREIPVPPVREVTSLLSLPRPYEEISGTAAVIIETRPISYLPVIVEQVYRRLGIPIHVFHGRKNGDLLDTKILNKLRRSGSLTLSELSCDSIDHTIYNALMMSPAFWEKTIARGRVLVFQADAVLCENSPFDLKDFEVYDYIGSLWGRYRPENIVVDGGNGGLSLRSWDQMMTCFERFPGHGWHGGEDTYFCFHMEIIGAQVGLPNACARFGTQFRFLEESFGAHKPNSLPFRDQIAFLGYCPEAAPIIEGKFASLKLMTSALLRATGFRLRR